MGRNLGPIVPSKRETGQRGGGHTGAPGWGQGVVKKGAESLCGKGMLKQSNNLKENGG